MAKEQTGKVAQVKRFQFGKNWEAFLSTLNEERICEAERSLKEMLCVDDLSEMSWLCKELSKNVTIL